MSPEQPAAAERPARKPFVRRAAMARMPADAAARQGRVAKLAWDALGERDAVLAFLNTHDDALGGRPIDLAIADEAGLASVEVAIAAAGRARSAT